nr:unnamed protein product [Callosobruchus analis]
MVTNNVNFVFIAGDFNIELKDENSTKTDLEILIQSYGMRLLINDYTRVTRQDWDAVYSCNLAQVNQQWETFINIFSSIFNESFPVRHIKPRSKRYNCFSNNDVRDCKSKLDILLVLAKNDTQFKELYDKTKKEYDSLLIKAKKDYYSFRIKNSDNKSKSCSANTVQDFVFFENSGSVLIS